MPDHFVKYQRILECLVGDNKTTTLLFYTQFPEIGYKTPYEFFLEDPQIFEDFFMDIVKSLQNLENV